jgi:hypothetical protein
MKDTKRYDRIEHARSIAKEHLGTLEVVFHGSYPHPTHGYEVFSFTRLEDHKSVKIGLPEIVNPN